LSESDASGFASRISCMASRDSVDSAPSSPRSTSHEPSAESSVPSVTRSPVLLTTRTREPIAFSNSPSPLATSNR